MWSALMLDALFLIPLLKVSDFNEYRDGVKLPQITVSLGPITKMDKFTPNMDK